MLQAGGWLVWDRPKFCAPSKMHGSVSAGELFILNAGPPPDYNNEKLSSGVYGKMYVAEREEMENARERERKTTKHDTCWHI